MTEHVLITMQSTQQAGGEYEQMPQVIVTGTYECADGIHRLTYDEALDDSGEMTHCVLQFGESFAQMNKNGQVQAEMRFEPGRRNIFAYRTPYGDLVMAALTREIILEQNGEELSLQIEYDIEVQDEAYTIQCVLNVGISRLPQ